MPKALLGKKVGMTQVFQPDGSCVPVTILQAGPCAILQVKTKENDGYQALKLGFDPKKEARCTKPELGEFKKANVTPRKVVGEVHWDDVTGLQAGQELNIDLFSEIKYVHVMSRTKGRGFTGVVKRWGFKGAPSAHGQTEGDRVPGSLGRQHSISQGVHPGKRMQGHYGDEQLTVRNFKVIRVDKEKNLLFVKGGVPGPNGAYVVVKESKKKLSAGPAQTGKKKHQVVKKK